MFQEMGAAIHCPGDIDDQDEEEAEHEPFPVLHVDPKYKGPIHKGPYEVQLQEEGEENAHYLQNGQDNLKNLSLEIPRQALNEGGKVFEEQNEGKEKKGQQN